VPAKTPQPKQDPKNARSTPSEHLWTVEDLARYLGRSARWVWSQLKMSEKEKGSIPHTIVGKRSPRFLRSQIEQWIEEGCPPAEAFRKRMEARR
jgi:predicted DNA-binding transcriptional regulator AlpA